MSTLKKKKMLSFLCILFWLISISGCMQVEQPNNHTAHDLLYVGKGQSEYQTIQQAIDAAQNNATIYIRSGSYSEVLTINTSVSLIGDDWNTTCIRYPSDSNSTQNSIITINADYCRIDNLQIQQDNIATLTHGISIAANKCTIANTTISGCENGIELSTFSTLNTIVHNTIRNNSIGIFVSGSRQNTISNNTLFFNANYSLYLYTGSDTNTIAYNLINTSDIGMKIYGSESNIFHSNCIEHNRLGVYCCCGGRNNYFYSNSFVNNSQKNAEDNEYNIWYHAITSTGNYWSDYNGSDMNNDGIGDTAYMISDPENFDSYPLMVPLVNVDCNH